MMKIRNKFQDKKAMRRDTCILSTKSILTISFTIYRDNMKIKDTQMGNYTMKVVEELLEEL